MDNRIKEIYKEMLLDHSCLIVDCAGTKAIVYVGTGTTFALDLSGDVEDDAIYLNYGIFKEKQ